MAKNKKITVKFNTILLCGILLLSLVHLTFLLLGLFNVITPDCLKRDSFNYILSFVLVGICLALYIIFLAIENSKKLIIPEWFKSVFFVGFYVFTNVYYYFGLFETLGGLIALYVFIAFVLNIIALSVFFNTQKTETNILKSSAVFTTLTTFTYAVSAGAMIETIISAIKLIVAREGALSTLSMVVVEMCIIILVSVIFAIIFGLSLSKKKTIVNGCLIKYYK